MIVRRHSINIPLSVTLLFDGVLEPFKALEHMLRCLCVLFPTFAELESTAVSHVTLGSVYESKIDYRFIGFSVLAATECHLVDLIQELVAADEGFQCLTVSESK